MTISYWTIKCEIGRTFPYKMQNVIFDQLNIFIVFNNHINSPRDLLLISGVANNFSLD